MTTNEDFHDGFLSECADVEKHGIVLKRVGDFMNPPAYETAVWTNVPHLVTHHSPSGFEWGYGGSGPADLALNIIELCLRKLGYEGPKMECWDKSHCFEAAWAMHHDFKFKAIAGFPKQGGQLDWQFVVDWVQANTPDYLKLEDKFGHGR